MVCYIMLNGCVIDLVYTWGFEHFMQCCTVNLFYNLDVSLLSNRSSAENEAEKNTEAAYPDKQ